MAPSVEDAVQKIMTAAPPAETPKVETPALEAPVTTPPVEEKPPVVSEETKKEETSQETADRTAFEQELIGQMDDADRAHFDALQPEQQQRNLSFAKKLYRQNAKQMTELGNFRKAAGALTDAGVGNEDLVALMKNKRAGTTTPPAPTTSPADDSVRGFKRYHKDTTTPEEREGVDKAEMIVRELVTDMVNEMLGKEVGPLKERLAQDDMRAAQARSITISQEINDLEDKDGYPGSLVETHREAMLRLGLRQTDLSAEDLLVRIAGMKAVKAAMLKSAGTAPDGTKPGAESTVPSSSVVSPPEAMKTPRNDRGIAPVTGTIDYLFRQIMKPIKR